MARILVAGADAAIAHQRMVRALVTRLQQDGHDAAPLGASPEAVRDADALVALLDDVPPHGAAAVALAHAWDKPVLGLATRGTAAPLFAALTVLVEVDSEQAWFDALPAFYDRIRPFAGRLVRDRIPQLVEEAGHDLRFRSLGADERPRFLKQKIAAEASELVAADLAKEKEEVADVLEALEAFILARGFDREDLRRIKQHKRKQRGGFERAFVVEATAAPQGAEPEGVDPARHPEGPALTSSDQAMAPPQDLQTPGAEQSARSRHVGAFGRARRDDDMRRPAPI